jgi:hypothetical protein
MLLTKIDEYYLAGVLFHEKRCTLVMVSKGDNRKSGQSNLISSEMPGMALRGSPVL